MKSRAYLDRLQREARDRAEKRRQKAKKAKKSKKDKKDKRRKRETRALPPSARLLQSERWSVRMLDGVDMRTARASDLWPLGAPTCEYRRLERRIDAVWRLRRRLKPLERRAFDLFMGHRISFRRASEISGLYRSASDRMAMNRAFGRICAAALRIRAIEADYPESSLAAHLQIYH